jgi:hypothetical protein
MLKTCVVCGREFEGRGSAATCSPECSRERKAARKREGPFR